MAVGSDLYLFISLTEAEILALTDSDEGTLYFPSDATVGAPKLIYKGTGGAVIPYGVSGGGDMYKEIYDPRSINADIFNVDNHTSGTANKVYTAAEKTKLAGIDSDAEANNISDTDAADLTDGGGSGLHYHDSDRDRANHTGTQEASTISDFDAEVSNNADVAANTAHKTSDGKDHSDVVLNNAYRNVGHIPTSEKGVAGGTATLDGGGKIPSTQLPSSVMEYKGTWNAATNTPTLANGTGDNGDVYLCGTAGTVNFGAGNISFDVGDWAVYNGSIWEKSLNSDSVVSVNGKTGVVTINHSETNPALAGSGEGMGHVSDQAQQIKGLKEFLDKITLNSGAATAFYEQINSANSQSLRMGNAYSLLTGGNGGYSAIVSSTILQLAANDKIGIQIGNDGLVRLIQVPPTGTTTDLILVRNPTTGGVKTITQLILGETSTTAYRGDRGKTAYDHSQLGSGNPHSVTKSDIGLKPTAYQTLTSAAAISFNVNSGINAKVTLAHSTTITFSNLTNGDTGNIDIVKDANTTLRNIVFAHATASIKIIRSEDNDFDLTASGQNRVFSYVYNGSDIKITYGEDYG